MGAEQHFLIVHCKKFDTFIPISLTSAPEVDVKRMNKFEPDFPCLKHNSDRDRMGEKFHFVPHGSESVLITVKNKDGQIKDATEEAVDKAVVIYQAERAKRAKILERRLKKESKKKKKK